jgi:hypothetical protein
MRGIPRVMSSLTNSAARSIQTSSLVFGTAPCDHYSGGPKGRNLEARFRLRRHADALPPAARGSRSCPCADKEQPKVPRGGMRRA